ncbi:MAG: tetratricopeptide repeat protein, partial [Myxococcaceae bacterium]
MVTPVLASLVLLAASPARPRVDVSAMKEAMEAPSDGYSSASAYAHFLRARLLSLQGEHARSVEQLRLALASDPGRPELVLALAEAQARAALPAKAEATVRGLLERRPDHVPALLFL